MTYYSLACGFKDTTVSLPQDSPDYPYHLFWWMGNGETEVNENIEIKKTTYTDYIRQFTYYKWSEYSDWQDDVISADENTQVETRTLYRYSLEATGHDYVEIETVDPSCTHSGYTVYQCSKCGSEYHDNIVDMLTHNYVADVTEPMCTEDGYTTYTCSMCGDNYTSDVVEKLGHNYTTIVTEPTCTTEGYTTYTCSVCGDKNIADVTPILYPCLLLY